jgi:hypothetical protein
MNINHRPRRTRLRGGGHGQKEIFKQKVRVFRMVYFPLKTNGKVASLYVRDGSRGPMLFCQAETASSASFFIL